MAPRNGMWHGIDIGLLVRDEMRRIEEIHEYVGSKVLVGFTRRHGKTLTPGGIITDVPTQPGTILLTGGIVTDVSLLEGIEIDRDPHPFFGEYSQVIRVTRTGRDSERLYQRYLPNDPGLNKMVRDAAKEMGLQR